MNNEDLDFSAYLAGFKRDRWLIYLSALLVGTVVCVVTYILPTLWQSSVVFLFPVQEQSAAAQALGALVGGGGGGAQDPLLIVKGVVESRATTNYILQHLPPDLQGKVKRDVLEKSISVKYDDDKQQLEIDAFWTSKKASLELLNLANEALKNFNQHAYFSVADQKLAMLGKALDEKDRDLKTEEKLVSDFQKHAKTVPDPTNPLSAGQYITKAKEAEYELDNVQQEIDIAQGEASKMAAKALDMPTAIPQQQAWRSQLTMQEYQLAQLEVQSGPSAPQVVALKADIEVTKKNLLKEVQKYLDSVNIKVDANMAQLEANRLILKWQVDFLKTLSSAAPGEAIKFQDLLTEAMARADALKATRMEYEQAKLDAEVSPVKWSTLVEPYTDDKPANKKYGLFGTLGVLVGLLLGWALSARKQYKLLKKAKERAENIAAGLE